MSTQTNSKSRQSPAVRREFDCQTLRSGCTLSLLFLALALTVSPSTAAPSRDLDSAAYVIPAPPLQPFVRLTPEKKSEPGLSDFMSAMNEASRLRYGKRAVLSSEEMTAPSIRMAPSRWSGVKRMASFSSSDNLPALIDSLNGAERLRFGRK